MLLLPHARSLDESISIHLSIVMRSTMGSAERAQALEAEDRIFRALSDPSRRAIFESLTAGEAAVKDLTARFDISQPAVSQHLAALSGAGLVNRRREGRSVYYRVEPRGLKPLVDWIAHYRVFWSERMNRLEQLLEEMEE